MFQKEKIQFFLAQKELKVHKVETKLLGEGCDALSLPELPYKGGLQAPKVFSAKYTLQILRMCFFSQSPKDPQNNLKIGFTKNKTKQYGN